MAGLPPTVPPPPAPCELLVIVKPHPTRADVIEVRGDAAGVSQLLDVLASGLANALLEPGTETEREVGMYRVRVRVT